MDRKPKPSQLEVDFGVKDIDNTAPVKKILSQLQLENESAFDFYCQTVRPEVASYRQLSYHFLRTGPPLYAFPENWDGDLNSRYFEPSAFKCSMPKIMTGLKNTKKNDPVAKCLKEKIDWKENCKKQRVNALWMSTIDKFEYLNEDIVQCPKLLVDVAAILESDPDLYFDESYNWYYSGNGNIQLICIDWVDYLLHSEFSTLYLTPFSKDEIPLKIDESITFDCDGLNILETICSTQNIVALRTKTKIYILKIICLDNKIEFEKIKCLEGDLPFTGISFDGYHKNILYITALNNDVMIVNLDRLTKRTVTPKTKLESLINNWNTVISSDRTQYIHVTKEGIHFYDKRTNCSNYTLNNISEISDCFNCNDLTAARQYKDSSSFYLATRHHLFLTDTRYQNQLKPKPVLRWTHGMQCAPTYMSFCDFQSNKELVCLCSQWCEDTCIISNYNRALTRDTEISGVSMPYRPPSILTSLDEVKEKLLMDLNIYDSVRSRVVTSITGNVIVESGENHLILLQNALGDITCHTLYPEHMVSFMDDDSASDSLHEWSKHYEPKKEQFEVSNIMDISNVWKMLRKIPDDYELSRVFHKDKKSRREIQKEIRNTFQNEEIDAELFSIWVKEKEFPFTERSSVLSNNSDSKEDSDSSHEDSLIQKKVNKLNN